MIREAVAMALTAKSRVQLAALCMFYYVYIHVHLTVQELQRESQIVSLQSGIKSAEITEPDQRQAG